MASSAARLAAVGEGTLAQALVTSRRALEELGYSLDSPEVKAALKRHEQSMRQHYLSEFRALVSDLKLAKGTSALFRKYANASTLRMGAAELKRVLPIIGLMGEDDEGVLAHYDTRKCGSLGEEAFCQLMADARRFGDQAVAAAKAAQSPTRARATSCLLYTSPSPRDS